MPGFEVLGEVSLVAEVRGEEVDGGASFGGGLGDDVPGVDAEQVAGQEVDFASAVGRPTPVWQALQR